MKQPGVPAVPDAEPIAFCQIPDPKTFLLPTSDIKPTHSHPSGYHSLCLCEAASYLRGIHDMSHSDFGPTQQGTCARIVNGTSHIHNPTAFDFRTPESRAIHRYVSEALTENGDSSALTEYKRMRSRILSVLNTSFPEPSAKWALTGVRRAPGNSAWDERGISDYEPTILIICQQPARLDGALSELALHTTLRIEVIMGSVEFFSAFGTGCPWLEERVNMGRSIGPLTSESSTSGTFGGYLVEVNTGKRLGLTAGHVCLNGSRVDSERTGDHALLNLKIQINQPSSADHAMAIEEASQNLKTSEEISAKYGYMRQIDEDVRRRDAETFGRLYLARCRLSFGTVVYAALETARVDDSDPGGREDIYVWKDYGLIEVHPARLGYNAYGFLDIAGQVSGLKRANGHVDLYPGQRLEKFHSRSSSNALGVVNGVYMDIRLSVCTNGKAAPAITQEWVVVGTNGPLSTRGDSGSLLVDEDRRVACMVIGGVGKTQFETNGGTIVDNITTVTPASRLLTWIKQDTGFDCEFGDSVD